MAYNFQYRALLGAMHIYKAATRWYAYLKSCNTYNSLHFHTLLVKRNGKLSCNSYNSFTFPYTNGKMQRKTQCRRKRATLHPKNYVRTKETFLWKCQITGQWVNKEEIGRILTEHYCTFNVFFKLDMMNNKVVFRNFRSQFDFSWLGMI